MLVLHGPNLNRLGTREPEVYGNATLAEIDRELGRVGAELGAAIDSRQTNHEGELVDWIQGARGAFDAILINPGAYTHTSIALRDAVVAAGVPSVEVHLSNPASREAFRHASHLEGVVRGRVAGFGAESYVLALRGIVAVLKERR